MSATIEPTVAFRDIERSVAFRDICRAELSQVDTVIYAATAKDANKNVQTGQNSRNISWHARCKHLSLVSGGEYPCSIDPRSDADRPPVPSMPVYFNSRVGES